MTCIHCGKEALRNSKICLACAELLVKGSTPQKSYKITSIKKRTWALTIESLLWMFFTYATLYFILTQNLSNKIPYLEQISNMILSSDHSVLVSIILQLTIAINILMIIYTGLMFHYFGTTLGKLCVGITIINQKTSQKLGILAGLFRDWVCKSSLNLIATILTFYASSEISSSFSLLFFVITLVQYLLPFFDKNKKALHDYLSGTIVVEEDQTINK